MLDHQIVYSLFEQQRDRRLSRWQIAFLSYYGLMGPGALILSTLFLFISGKDAPALLWVWGVIHSGLLFWFLYDARNDQICAGMMLQALSDGGRQLAWVYRCDTLTAQGALQGIAFHFRFTNKRHGSLSTTDEMVSGLLAYFAQNYPQISTGYSAELEKDFLRSPQSCKENPQRSHAVKVESVDYSQSNGW